MRANNLQTLILTGTLQYNMPACTCLMCSQNNAAERTEVSSSHIVTQSESVDKPTEHNHLRISPRSVDSHPAVAEGLLTCSLSIL